ncbi:MAG: outer membrane protein assembly factor BamB family protein [Ruminiclostridium sp.]
MKNTNNGENISLYNLHKEENNEIFSSHINWTRQSKNKGCNNPKIKWEFQLSDNIHESSPVIDKNGTIYFGGNKGFFYAIQENGKLKWKINLRQNLQTPVIYNDNIFIATTGAVGTTNHRLYSINFDGFVNWECIIGESAKYSPVVSKNGEIYIVSHGSKISKITINGLLEWVYHKQFGCTFMPCITKDGTIYIGGGRSFTAVNPNGTEKWSIPLSNLQSPSPVIDNQGTIYVDINDNNQVKLFAINPNGTLKWQYSHEKDIWTSPALSNSGTLYVGATYFKLLAINIDGTFKWESKLDGFFTAPPLIGVDGTIYVTTSKQVKSNKYVSRLEAFNEDGTKIWKIAVDGSTNWPALSTNSTFYLAVHDSSNNEIGKLYSIGD